LFTLGYSVRFISRNGRMSGLREFLFVKQPLLAGIWTISTLILPLCEASVPIFNAVVMTQFFARFFFIFALCIPFEIRDYEIERSGGTETIPVAFGIRKTKIIGNIVVVLSLIGNHLWQSIAGWPLIFAIALDVSAVCAFFGIAFSAKKHSEYYCLVFVDGIMLVRFLLIYLTITFFP